MKLVHLFARAYGWSSWGEANARRFAQTGGAAMQTKLNLFSYDPALVAACEAGGLAVLANAPLAMGMLTGKFDAGTRFSPDDVRGAGHTWLEYFEHGKAKPAFLGRLAAVRDVLQSGGRTVAQGALGWLWAKSGSVIPIPGFKNKRQAAENAGALAYGPLGAAEMREIDRLLAGEQDAAM